MVTEGGGSGLGETINKSVGKRQFLRTKIKTGGSSGTKGWRFPNGAELQLSQAIKPAVQSQGMTSFWWSLSDFSVSSAGVVGLGETSKHTKNHTFKALASFSKTRFCHPFASVVAVSLWIVPIGKLIHWKIISTYVTNKCAIVWQWSKEWRMSGIRM